MYQKGLVAGTEGNLSPRVSDKEIRYTPSASTKVTSPRTCWSVYIDGNIVAGDRGAHFRTVDAHRGVPPASRRHGRGTRPSDLLHRLSASARVPLPEGILPELIATIGEVPLVPYGKPSSPKLAEAVRPYYPNHNCFLLENHGALAVGVRSRSLLQAGGAGSLPVDHVLRQCARRSPSA